jgi:hypothetical protein
MLQTKIEVMDLELAKKRSHIELLTEEIKQLRLENLDLHLRLENRDLQEQLCQPPPTFTHDSAQSPKVTTPLPPACHSQYQDLEPSPSEDTEDEVETPSKDDYVPRNLAEELLDLEGEVSVEESREDKEGNDHHLPVDPMPENNLTLLNETGSQETTPNHDSIQEKIDGIANLRNFPEETKKRSWSVAAAIMPPQLQRISARVERHRTDHDFFPTAPPADVGGANVVQLGTGLPNRFPFTFTIPNPTASFVKGSAAGEVTRIFS